MKKKKTTNKELGTESGAERKKVSLLTKQVMSDESPSDRSIVLKYVKVAHI